MAEMFLKLDDVQGESQDTAHVNEIEISSWGWSVDNPASFKVGQGGQSTQANFSSIHVNKICDKASITLFKACATGKHIGSGKITCRKLDGDSKVDYLTIDLKDIMVTNVSWSGSGSEQILHETVSLVFAEFKQTYKLQQDTGDAGGATDFGFDIQSQKIS
jgi:type VI secretion system secreted protein Hcp